MAESNQKKIRILIADDDFSVRNAVRAALKDTKYEIIGEASDGMIITEMAKNLKPDMVLLDIEMPNLDGISASKLILQNKNAFCTIMLTSFDDLSFVNKAMEGGAEGYITKPFDSKQLIATLDMCFKQSKERYILEKEVMSLEKKIQGKDTVNSAKLLLMETKGLSENDAYSYIRELSRRKNISMDSVAEMLLAKGE